MSYEIAGAVQGLGAGIDALATLQKTALASREMDLREQEAGMRMESFREEQRQRNAVRKYAETTMTTDMVGSYSMLGFATNPSDVYGEAEARGIWISQWNPSAYLADANDTRNSEGNLRSAALMSLYSSATPHGMAARKTLQSAMAIMNQPIELPLVDRNTWTQLADENGNPRFMHMTRAQLLSRAPLDEDVARGVIYSTPDSLRVARARQIDRYYDPGSKMLFTLEQSKKMIAKDIAMAAGAARGVDPDVLEMQAQDAIREAKWTDMHYKLAEEASEKDPSRTPMEFLAQWKTARQQNESLAFDRFVNQLSNMALQGVNLTEKGVQSLWNLAGNQGEVPDEIASAWTQLVGDPVKRGTAELRRVQSKVLQETTDAKIDELRKKGLLWDARTESEKLTGPARAEMYAQRGDYYDARTDELQQMLPYRQAESLARTAAMHSQQELAELRNAELSAQIEEDYYRASAMTSGIDVAGKLLGVTPEKGRAHAAAAALWANDSAGKPLIDEDQFLDLYDAPISQIMPSANQAELDAAGIGTLNAWFERNVQLNWDWDAFVSNVGRGIQEFGLAPDDTKAAKILVERKLHEQLVEASKRGQEIDQKKLAAVAKYRASLVRGSDVQSVQFKDALRKLEESEQKAAARGDIVALASQINQRVYDLKSKKLKDELFADPIYDSTVPPDRQVAMLSDTHKNGITFTPVWKLGSGYVHSVYTRGTGLFSIPIMRPKFTSWRKSNHWSNAYEAVADRWVGRGSDTLLQNVQHSPESAAEAMITAAASRHMERVFLQKSFVLPAKDRTYRIEDRDWSRLVKEFGLQTSDRDPVENKVTQEVHFFNSMHDANKTESNRGYDDLEEHFKEFTNVLYGPSSNRPSTMEGLMDQEQQFRNSVMEYQLKYGESLLPNGLDSGVASLFPNPLTAQLSAQDMQEAAAAGLVPQ